MPKPTYRANAIEELIKAARAVIENSEPCHDPVMDDLEKALKSFESWTPGARAPLDEYVEQFIEVAMDPESTDEEIFKEIKPIVETISLPLVAPMYGTIVGLSKTRPKAKQYMGTLEIAGEAFIDRPGYNDFLMADWKISHDQTLIPRMIERTNHEDDAIADSALWMICSVAQQDPSFMHALELAGYDVLVEGDHAVGLRPRKELVQ